MRHERKDAMDIAVTGSTGFLGKALTRHLRGAGHKVVPVVRPQTKGGSPDVVEWDPPRDRIDAGGLEGIDAVIHLAGVSIGSARGSQKVLRAIRESRTVPTALLARTLGKLQRPPRVLISQSAVGYYGDRGDDLIDEGQPPGDDRLAVICRDWEAATAAAREGGVRVIRTRTGLVLDPSGSLLQKLLWPTRVGLGAWFGDGSHWQSWISLADQNAAMVHLLDADVEGPVNVAAPNPVTNRQMIESIARAAGRKARFGIPQPVLDIGAGKELGRAMTSSQRVDVSKLTATGFTFTDEELDKALDRMMRRSAA